MKTILIVGLGRFGKHMAGSLIENGNEVMGIDNVEERVNEASQYVSEAQIGDATNPQFIASIGVNNFDLCVVAIGDNFQSSLECTSLLKESGAKFVVARAHSDVHKKFLLNNGADEVVYAEREMAERLAMKYGSDNIFDYIELTADYSIYEISVPPAWVGKTIIGKEVRTKHHISILATKENGVITPLPRPEHVFTATETLMIMGHTKDVMALVK